MRLLKTLLAWLVCVIFFAILASMLVYENATSADILLSAGFAILFYLRLADDIYEYNVSPSDIPNPRIHRLGFIKGISFYVFTFVALCVPIITIRPNFVEYYVYLTMILLMLNIILSLIPHKKSQKVKK